MKFFPIHTTKAYVGSRDLAPHIVIFIKLSLLSDCAFVKVGALKATPYLWTMGNYPQLSTFIIRSG